MFLWIRGGNQLRFGQQSLFCVLPPILQSVSSTHFFSYAELTEYVNRMSCSKWEVICNIELQNAITVQKGSIMQKVVCFCKPP